MLSQFGNERVKPADALRVASSIFSEGLAHLHAGRLTEALSNFEASLSMNQKFLSGAALESINCFHQIASVHDKLGNLGEAAAYYERARAQLASAPIPPGERGVFAKRRRNELLRQVQQRLDMMPRLAQVPKVGAGVPLADLRKLYDSLLASGDRQLAEGELAGAELAFEQALALCRTHHRAIALGGGGSAAGSSGTSTSGETSAEVANAAAVAVSDCLSRLAEVHQRNGEVMVAEAHIVAAIDVLTGDVLADDRGLSNEQGPLSPISLHRHALPRLVPTQAAAAAVAAAGGSTGGGQDGGVSNEGGSNDAETADGRSEAKSVAAAAAAIEAAFDDSDEPEFEGEEGGGGASAASAAATASEPSGAPPLPPSTPLQAISAAAREERLTTLRQSLASLQGTPSYRRASERWRQHLTPQRGRQLFGSGGPRDMSEWTPQPRTAAYSASLPSATPPQPSPLSQAVRKGGTTMPPPQGTPSAPASHPADGVASCAATPASMRTPLAGSAPRPPPPSAGASSMASAHGSITPDGSAGLGGGGSSSSGAFDVGNLHNTASSLAVAAQSAAAAVSAAVAAQQAAAALAAEQGESTSTDVGGVEKEGGAPAGAQAPPRDRAAAEAEAVEVRVAAEVEKVPAAAEAAEAAKAAKAEAEEAAAVEEEDEFAWRKDQGSDEEEDDGPVDDRVEGAIEQINVERDAMTNAQLAADAAQRECERAEAHTASELLRLQEENASHLGRLAAYEMAKALSSEAQQAADEAVAKHGQAGAATELAHARRTQGDSMQMAMELSGTFEALVPYFVYRTVLEQELEERRQGVVRAKEAVRASRRRYNGAMEALETISREIMEAKELRKQQTLQARREAEEAAKREAEEEEARAREGAERAAAEAAEAAANAEAAEMAARTPGSPGSSYSACTPDSKGLNAIPTKVRSPSVVAALNGMKYLGRQASRERGVKRL